MALVALIVASAVLAASLSRLRTWTAGIVFIASLGSALVCVQIAPLATLLHLAPLHVDDWIAAVLGGLGAALPTLGFRIGHRRKRRS
jgi:Ca2+-transporting ATPase